MDGVNASAEHTTPGVLISVVVPVRNALASLPACIESLRAQHFPREKFEILCVDNGSNDGSREYLARAAGVTLTHAERRGASAARNAGLRQARGHWVAFTDADCVAHPGWLVGLHAMATRTAPADLIGGRIIAHRPVTDVERFTERLFDQARAIGTFTPPYVISANLLARREWLLAVGGFDESFLRGQDVELSFRAYFRHKARFAFAGDAVVEHVNPATAWALWRKALQHGQASAGIHARFGTELGTTMRQRACSMKRYRALTRLAVEAGLESLQRVVLGQRPASKDKIYELILEAGKQLGFLRCWLAASRSGGGAQ